MNATKIEAIKTARKIISMDPVYLDTETTGLSHTAEIVDIAIIDSGGQTLVDTLVNPSRAIPDEATKIHGITNGDVLSAPLYNDLVSDLNMYSEQLIIIYNRDYDLRVLAQSARANDVSAWVPKETVCAMELYAEYHGDWDSRRRSYRWQKQSIAAQRLGIEIPEDLHRAAADANLCRLIIEAMAATPLPGEATQESQLFIESFNSLAEHAHEMAKRNGFWETDFMANDGNKIALIHREISEAYEALRGGNMPDDKISDFNGYEVELADAIIRIMDLANARELRVAEAIIAKMAYNETRPYKHGNEF